MKTEHGNQNIQQSDCCNVIDLIEFKDKEEKNRYVDCVHIKSIEQLVLMLSDLKSKNSFFRGQKHWKWRVNSGAQREWFKNRLFIEKYYKGESSVNQFFQEFLNFIKSKILKIQQSAQDDFSLISELQHYGAPTPFIDFTTQPWVALFFALGMDSCESAEVVGDTNCSLYSFQSGKGAETPANDWTNYSEIIRQDLEPAFATPTLKCNNLVNTYRFLEDFSCIYLRDDETDLLKLYNPRLAAQKGMFVHLGKKKQHRNLDEVTFLGSDGPSEGQFKNDLSFTKLVCLEISPQLFPRITQEIQKRNITRKSLLLDDANLAGSFFGKLLFECFMQHLTGK